MLEAEEYLDAGPLGAALAALMRPPGRGRAARVALHVACIQRIGRAVEAGEVDEARGFLLVNLVATYLALSDEEQERVRQQLQQAGDTTMETTELTWADQWFLRGREAGREEGRAEGREEGREEGRLAGRQEGTVEGLREATRLAIERHFGSLPPELATALQAMTREQVVVLFDRVLSGAALDELV